MDFLIRFLKLHSLKSRLRFFGIFLVLMVGVLTISSYSYTEYRQTEGNLLQSMHKNGSIQQTIIDNWMSTRASEIRNLANLQSTKTNNKDNLHKDLVFFANHQQEFESISFTNKEGIVEFSTINQLGVYFTEQIYFEEAKNGHEYVSNIIIGKLSKQPTILFSSPVFDENKQFYGVVFGTVSLKTIDQLMSQFRNGISGESYLIDRNGLMITESRFLKKQDHLQNQIISEILNRAIQEDPTSSTYSSYRGKVVYGTYQFVNQHKWIAVSEMERNEVFYPFYKQLVNMSIIILIVLTLGILTMLQISSRIEQPILHLLRGAYRVQDGEYEYKIDYKGIKSAPLELVQLCEAFNQMSLNIHKKEDELKQQAEELAQSNAELEQFAYVASHDLQEPLRMVASYVQLLAKRYQGKLDADADDFIHYAVDGAHRMQNLINDLLAFSRVGTAGKEHKSIDCQIVLQHVLANLKHAIQESAATITHDPMPKIIGDATQMAQLLQNLIGNGIKFRNADKTPLIHIGVEHQKNEWIFSVRDNGIGFDSQYKDKIFLIFQRLHNKTKYPGTGIGLSICKKIVERHGGKIWVESVLGSSTTFFFKLPDKRI